MDVKRGRLPLTALRSFEAAGRHLSFSRAAEEMFVSQAAISRQIRELETFVGRSLFERLHRRVALTEAGGRLLSQLTRSFDDMEQQLSDIVATPAQHLLAISVEPSFGRSWLVPRLNDFRQMRPDIDVSVDIDIRVVEFRAHEAQLAIRHSVSTSSWPRTQSLHLADVAVTPMLSPSLLAAGWPLREPADLARYTLLHEENRDRWHQWFEATGTEHLAPQRGPIFPDGALAAQAATLGHGVTLGTPLLSARELATGELVAPFPTQVPDGSYWLVAPDLERLGEPARAFAEWLRETLKDR